MRHYLLVFLRLLSREKLYAGINIAGLALGVACCLVLGLYLRSELTYDRFHLQHEQIYRVVNEFTTNGVSGRFALTSRAMGPMLAADHPEIKAYVRFQHSSPDGGVAIRYGDVVHYWEDTYFVDENVLDVFTHDIVYGDPKTALKEGGGTAVSETFAKRYFGDENPIGKTVATDAGLPLKINLVFADLPRNAHLRYDILFSGNLPFLTPPEDLSARREQLFGISDFTYVLMDRDYDPADWTRISDEFFAKHMAEGARRRNSEWHSWLQPLADIHLWSDVSQDLPTGNRIYLYGCAAVALFILIVACINYMNLATARATRRARSVGVRKILGASRLALGAQFLAEAVAFALIALVLGVVIVEVTLTYTPLNSLMGGDVRLDFTENPALAGWLLGLGVTMGVLSGAYPAFYLSSWAPLTALTGRHLAGKGNLRMREALVLLQFTISAAVIASTLLMVAQMRYVAGKSLGFEKENRLLVRLRGADTLEKIPAMRGELEKSAHVLAVTQAELVPGQETPVNLAGVERNDGAVEPAQFTHMPVGVDFIQVMGIEVVQGRDFSKRLLTDVGAGYVVNEAMVRRMGWSEPLGKRIVLNDQPGRVIGVTRDFHFRSLHTLVEPLVMYPMQTDYSQVQPLFRPFRQGYLILSISGDEVADTLAYIEKIVTEADRLHGFEYAFLDDRLDSLYKSEQRLTTLISIFATVCIFIACLGLFGLAAFATEQRTREIGTRKVLGATTMQIIAMLAKRVLLLVLVAAAIASVIAYFAIDEWLAAFAYRAGINPLVFVLSAIVAALVAFVTVALQSYRTAGADPVQALRHV